MYITYEKDTKLVAYIGEKKPVAYSDGLNLAEVKSVPKEYDFLTYEDGVLIAHFKTDEEKAKEEALARIAELKGLLSATDYQAIKFAEGELTAEEYTETKEQRRAWRAEINRLEEV